MASECGEVRRRWAVCYRVDLELSSQNNADLCWRVRVTDDEEAAGVDCADGW